jgi:hypothetical protein
MIEHNVLVLCDVAVSRHFTFNLQLMFNQGTNAEFCTSPAILQNTCYLPYFLIRMSNLQRKTNACYGIECWLRSQGLKVTTKTVSDITASFLKSKGLPYTKFNPRYKGLFNAGICNAETVQEHFKDFKAFVIENYVNVPVV